MKIYDHKTLKCANEKVLLSFKKGRIYTNVVCTGVYLTL